MRSPAPYVGRFPAMEQNKDLYKSEQRMLFMRATSIHSEGEEIRVHSNSNISVP